MMNKNDLSDGMRLILRNGHEKLYLNKNLLHFKNPYSLIISGIRLEKYNDDLTHPDGDWWDVVTVYYNGDIIYNRYESVDIDKVVSINKYR